MVSVNPGTRYQNLLKECLFLLLHVVCHLESSWSLVSYTIPHLVNYLAVAILCTGTSSTSSGMDPYDLSCNYRCFIIKDVTSKVVFLCDFYTQQ